MILQCLVGMTFTGLMFAFAAAPAMAESSGTNGQPPPPACVLPAKPLQRLELIFGLSSKQGPVSERAWNAFAAREIAPRFPDGFSIFDGHGHWRDKQGKTGQEASRLLLVWYVPDANSNAKIEAIREAYKKRFHQESVLRADEVSCVSF